MGFQLGETYSGYQFLDVIKRSKNGVEYRVKNTWGGRLELLRALPKTAEDDPDLFDRFVREMRLRACLIHPNIVTLFNAIEMESQLIMTTELVEGPTLAEKLQSGPLPWREAVALARQALAAAACAHQQKIVHRDITPENIIITPDGVLKLTNFGLAKASADPKLTQVGTAIGNLKYTSPEQIKGLGDVDLRTDLYSLGMVLYEMLSGRPAFTSESQFELMAAQVNQMPPSPHELNPAIPAGLGAVVLKAIAKDPAGRYQTAMAFDAALAAFGGADDRSSSSTQAPQAQIAASPEPPPAIAEVSPPARVAEVPSFPTAPGPSQLTKQLVVGSAAAAGLGFLLMTLWFVFK